jgi:hypothetical protein
MLKFIVRAAYTDAHDRFRVLVQGGKNKENLTLCGEILLQKPEWDLLQSVLVKLPADDILIEDSTKK